MSAVDPFLEIEAHVIARQRNVDPMAQALNQGRFLGMLARGVRLNPLQRLGAILLAAPILLVPILMVAGPIYDFWLVLANYVSSLWMIIVAALILSRALLPNEPLPPEPEEDSD